MQIALAVQAMESESQSQHFLIGFLSSRLAAQFVRSCRLPRRPLELTPDFKRSATPEIRNFHRFHLKHLQFGAVNIFCSDSVGDNLFPQFDLAEMLFGNAFAFPGPWVKIDGSRHPQMQFRQEPANMLI